MFPIRFRLGVGLTTLFAFALASPDVNGQVVTLPTVSGGWSAMAAALDPVTDDIMVVGTENTDDSGFVAASLTYNGAVTNVFGGGIVRDAVAASKYEAWPYTCAVDYEGRLLSAGICGTKSGDAFAVVRYDTNGDLEKTFGTKGIVTTLFNGVSQATLRAMTLQYSGANEKIVVAGSDWEQNPVLLARYTNTGALDTTFGSGGTVQTTTPFEYVIVQDMVVQSDGSIIVCAEGLSAGEPTTTVLMRYTPNGQLDTTFGSDGYATLSIDGESTSPRGIAVDADDRIVVAGACEDDDDYLALVRFTADGDLDDTFGDGGGVTESFAASAEAVAIDDDGDIVIAGISANGENLVVARFTSDGDLDDTFGSSDGVFNGQGYADDFAYSPCADSVQLQPSSSDPLGYKILLVGSSDDANVVVRYKSNGTPDASF